MKAVRVYQSGGAEVLKFEDVPGPLPKPHEVLIGIKASGVNYIDVYFRSGLYTTPIPMTLGLEAAGEENYERPSNCQKLSRTNQAPFSPFCKFFRIYGLGKPA